MSKYDFAVDNADKELDQLQRRESINAFLTEKFLGDCWHEWDTGSYKGGFNYIHFKCLKCKKTVSISDDFNKTGIEHPQQQDLFTADGFFVLWNKAQEQEWWAKFMWRDIIGWNQDSVVTDNLKQNINPQTFPILLAEFLGWKEGE